MEIDEVIVQEMLIQCDPALFFSPGRIDVSTCALAQTTGMTTHT